MSDGEGVVPDDVLVEYIGDATLLDPVAVTKRYAYVPFHDFVTPKDTRLGYFTVLGELRFLQREPGALYTPGTGFSDDMELTVPCQIVTPTAENEELDVVPELDGLIIDIGAMMLRGEIASRAALVS